MLIRAVRNEERAKYDSVVQHPLQSWAWGEFRKQTGVAVERLGFYENGQLTQGLQTTFHPIPLLGKTAGYVPKGFAPNEDQLAALKTLGEQHHALFIKLEPDVSAPIETAKTQHQTLQKSLHHTLLNSTSLNQRINSLPTWPIKPATTYASPKRKGWRFSKIPHQQGSMLT